MAKNPDGEKETLTCADCKFYKPIDETIGMCFDREIPSNNPANECPIQSFKAKDRKLLHSKSNSSPET